MTAPAEEPSQAARTLLLLEEALQVFVRLEPAPILSDDGAPMFPVCSHRIVEVCKAARIVSALHAIWILLAANHTTEATALLRMVSDYAREIQFLFAAQSDPELSEDYRRFMAEFFREMPGTVDEWRAERVRRKAAGRHGRFVERSQVNIGGQRLLAEVPDVDLGDVGDTRGAIDHVLNGYVHGAYATAMELYNPGHRRFDVFGMGNPRGLAASAQFAVANLVEPLTVFNLMAQERGLMQLAARLDARSRALIISPEYTRDLSEDEGVR